MGKLFTLHTQMVIHLFIVIYKIEVKLMIISKKHSIRIKHFEIEMFPKATDLAVKRVIIGLSGIHQRDLTCILNSR
jgi:hypothetical protein